MTHQQNLNNKKDITVVDNIIITSRHNLVFFVGYKEKFGKASKKNVFHIDQVFIYIYRFYFVIVFIRDFFIIILFTQMMKEREREKKM